MKGKNVFVQQLVFVFVIAFVYGCTTTQNEGNTTTASSAVAVFAEEARVLSRQTTKAGGSIEGTLPQNVIDRTRNIRGDVAYAYDKRTLRITFDNHVTGFVELVSPIAANTNDAFYRVTVRAKSEDESEVKVGVRRVAGDYRYLSYERNVFFGIRTLPLTKEYKTYTYDVYVPATDDAIAFALNVMEEGRVDVASVTLTRYSRDAYTTLSLASLSLSNENLLRVTQFPLGLQSGWALFRYASQGETIRVVADTNKQGPSGSPALHLRPLDSPYILTGDPFALPVPTRPYTFSFSMAGKGRYTVKIKADAKDLVVTNITLADDAWHRVSLTLPAEPSAVARVLFIKGETPLWLDAFSLAEGDTPSPYTVRGDVEVALAVESVARVQFDDEPARMRYHVAGDVTGGTLVLDCVNVYGTRKRITTTALTKETRRGEVRYDVFPNVLYGPFRVEAWVERDGKRVSACNELVVYRLRRPRYYGKDAPDSPFGIHVLAVRRSMEMAKAIGCNWVRLWGPAETYAAWSHVEPAKGTWRFHHDKIDAYRSNHLSLLGVLAGTPRWARVYKEHTGDGFKDMFFIPHDMNDYGAYVRRIVAEYEGKISHYEVWNEPWGAFLFTDYKEGKHVKPEDPAGVYADLMRVAYAAAKEADSNVVVVGLNTTAEYYKSEDTNHWGEAWTRACVVREEVMPVMDAISYHLYTDLHYLGYPDDFVARSFDMTFAPVVEKFGSIPKDVWLSEGSSVRWKTRSGFYNHTLPYDANENHVHTSRHLAGFALSLLAKNVKRMFLYELSGGVFAFESGSYRTFGTEEGYLHPSAAAFSALTWHLEDTLFQRIAELADGVYAYLFQGEGRSVAVIVKEPASKGAYSWKAEKGALLCDLFGNPCNAIDSVANDDMYYVMAEEDADALLARLR